jgi:hypothetical protein
MRKATRFGALASAAGAVALAGSLALAVGGASAAVTGTPLTTANGEAGYGATTTGHATLDNVQSVVTPNQYGTTIQGGAVGIGLETAPVSGKCYAAQLGLVANTLTSTYNVEYGNGNIGTGVGTDAACPLAGVESTKTPISASLSNLTNDSSVWLSLSYIQPRKQFCFWAPWGHRGRWGHHQSCWTNHNAKPGLLFAAEDLDATSPVVVTKWVYDPHNFIQAQLGISLDTAAASVLSPGAAVSEPGGSPVTGGADTSAYTSETPQEVAEFDYATVTRTGSHTPENLDGAGLTTEDAIDGPVTGALVDAHDSLFDSSPFPVSPVLGAYVPSSIHGASASGNSFQLFTGNSIGS